MPRRAQDRPYSPPQITSADRHRYNLFRDGVSTAEIATRDRVGVAQVEKSILRCREERQRYSQEAIEVAVRRTVLERLPQSSEAISGALTATRKERIAVIVTDPETNQPVQMENTVDVPDHKTRLSGHSALIELISSIRANVPMVNVDARSQTNNVLGIPAHTAGPSSAEAVIREIRAARGLALTDGAVVEGTANPVAMAEIDIELAEELEDDEEGDEDEEDLEPEDDDAE